MSIATSASFATTLRPTSTPSRPQEDLTELVEVADDQAFILHPGEFVLGSTLERVRFGHDLVARLEGKSSLGRLGLLIHSTAGFVDAGFDGHLTLELSNVANLPIAIYPGMKIGQISFLRMTTPADRPYGGEGTSSKYQGQRGPTPSRYYRTSHRTRELIVDDDGTAISYKLLERGTPMRASDGTPLGTVDRVLENRREHVFDGIVMPPTTASASWTLPRWRASPSAR